MLFDHISSEVKPIAVTELTAKLVTCMGLLGVEEVKESTKKHMRRKSEEKFEIVQDANRRIFLIPNNLSRYQLAEAYISLEKKLRVHGYHSRRCWV